MSRFILTAAEMRAAEAAVIASGTPARSLMERAGSAAAEAIWRFAGPLPTLVLCGPGNNGGEGYVIARRLAERGSPVRVAAAGEPKSDDARSARAAWTGPVETLADAAPAPLLVDALFGTGLARPLEEPLSARLAELAGAASVRVAIDLPSGTATDDGAILSPVPDFDLTVAFATLKPSHLLQPAARHMGRIAVADIGIGAESLLSEIGRPVLRIPGPDDHKYSRGYVVVLGGEMPGAAALTASAALRAGAGYVRLIAASPISGVPAAVVQSCEPDLIFADKRIDAIAIGPGLGRGRRADALLDSIDRAESVPIPTVYDADALFWLGENPRALDHAILTPHAGEFARLFPDIRGSKVERARAAASLSGAVIVYKGADTVVAAPDGRAAIASSGCGWLATAGAGDVLSGIVAAMRAGGRERFEAACAAVWLHGRAAGLAGPALVADDLIERLPQAIAECR